MAGREYVIPANFFGPKAKNEPDVMDIKQGIGFFLFLPDLEGYTKENWRNRFDRQLIKVERLGPVDKAEMSRDSDGVLQPVSPASYGDPEAGFRNLRGVLEDKPSLNAFGLKGYRLRSKQSGVHWTGTRSNGEFFFFTSSLAPGEALPHANYHPHCAARYYSAAEDLFIAYSYSMDHIEKWKEIDDGVWARIHGWRT